MGAFYVLEQSRHSLGSEQAMKYSILIKHALDHNEHEQDLLLACIDHFQQSFHNQHDHSLHDYVDDGMSISSLEVGVHTDELR